MYQSLRAEREEAWLSRLLSLYSESAYVASQNDSREITVVS